MEYLLEFILFCEIDNVAVKNSQTVISALDLIQSALNILLTCSTINDHNLKFMDFLTAPEMQGWLKEEIRDIEKARELRIKEATDFVDAYASGKLSQAEAMERLFKYDRRWGEALFGTSAAEGMTDEAILLAIDRTRESSTARHRKLPSSPSNRVP
jgi:hypothetical protein